MVMEKAEYWRKMGLKDEVSNKLCHQITSINAGCVVGSAHRNVEEAW